MIKDNSQDLSSGEWGEQGLGQIITLNEANQIIVLMGLIPGTEI